MAATFEGDLDSAKAVKEARNAAAGATAAGNPDAARYAVLRRLAPALKHDMVVNLQAASMMAEVMGARMEKGLPPGDELPANLARMNRLTREAVAGCLAVATWIEPSDEEAIELSAGVQDCVAVLSSNFSFRGFGIANAVAGERFPVNRTVLRNHLVAAMLCLTDEEDTPCELTVTHSCTPTAALLTIRSGQRLEPIDSHPVQVSYKQLAWADVQAMALEDSVECVRTGGEISLRLPRMVVTRPLRITPV